MTTFDIVIRFSLSVLLMGGLVYMGYIELCRRKESIVGLSTWAFAFLPFVGFVGGIATWEIIWLPVRVALVILLVVGAWIFMPKLFKKARAKFSNFEEAD